MYNAGVTAVDNRANANSTNYKTGYNNGYNAGYAVPRVNFGYSGQNGGTDENSHSWQDVYWDFTGGAGYYVVAAAYAGGDNNIMEVPRIYNSGSINVISQINAMPGYNTTRIKLYLVYVSGNITDILRFNNHARARVVWAKLTP